MRSLWVIGVVVILVFTTRSSVAANVIITSADLTPFQTFDLCVYGASSSGVITAVTGARKGLNVLIVEPLLAHIGGMTSSGLGETDVGDASTIGGFTREFYVNIGRHYHGAGNTDPVYVFEPHVAEQVFMNMTETAGDKSGGSVHVIFEAGDTVQVTFDDSNKRITSITVTDSRGISKPFDVRALMFVDASYDGDLLADVPTVRHTFGRESVSEYNETFAGVQKPWPVHVPVDPYVQPGNATSGLLRGISSSYLAPYGSADDLLQSYNYRLCLTYNQTNRIPFTQPIIYDPVDYEAHARWIIASGITSLSGLLSMSMLPHDKTDVNNQYEMSTDYINGNNIPYHYIRANASIRAWIRQEHRRYTLGFLWFLSQDTRVAASIRTEMNKWGFCADEFVDNDYFPWQLYVRESRRMIGSYVMTQHDCRFDGQRPRITDGIALGSYGFDCHSVQRLALYNDTMKKYTMHEEGLPAVLYNLLPYTISYSSLIPQRSSCTNLLVTICLSASHVAYLTIRMEPVYMQLSQAAATAAWLAIKNQTTLQDINTNQLRSILKTDGQNIDPPSITNTLLLE